MASHPFYPAFVSNRLWHPLRISDVSSQSALRDSAIYSDFFRPLGVDRQMAVAIPSPNNTAGVLVFSRKGPEFGDLEATLLSAMIPHIAKAEKRAGAFPGSSSRSVRLLPSADADSAQFCYTLIDTLNITLRQGEILWWLSHGKTDQDIAGLCSISKRTVQKHLENMYARLGVENRTAAVLRALESYRRFQA
jgi:DNA-binding CsgD family transcriptional regulator